MRPLDEAAVPLQIDSNVLFFQSLSVLVGAAVPKARPVLESQLEQLLTMVHAQVMGTAARSPAQRDVTVVSKSVCLRGEALRSLINDSSSVL